MERVGNVTQRDRRQVLARDGEQCAARGVLPGRCGGILTMGHIVGRGMGGTPAGHWGDTPAWLVTQCLNHNTRIETDSATAEAARITGHKLNRLEPRPERALVRYPDGWYYLNDDDPATRTALPIPEEASWATASRASD